MKQILLLLILASASQAAWLTGWKYRATLTVTNTQSGTLTSYPVQLSLTSSNFTFSQALSDGSDLRITDTDGVTIIPYTITAYDSVGQTATIWIKVPSVAGSGTYAPYLYWGNAAPAAFTIPPLGPFRKYASNPVLGDGVSAILAEDIAWDPATSEYWVIAQGTPGFAHSTDLLAWTSASGSAGGTSPHILLYSGTWYQYYGDGSNGISVATSSTVNGTYSGATQVIPPVAATWESGRCLEPYVFQDTDGTWVMLYMGDNGPGPTGEQVGLATASSPGGPFTKYSGNPVIAFGTSATYDAGTVADPYAYKLNGVYYVFYACSNGTSGWQTCAATSTDLHTFTRFGLWSGVWKGNSNATAWDRNAAFRGALIRVGNTYYINYNGSGTNQSQMGIATQSAVSSAAGYPAEQIFSFLDNFTTYDDSIWGYSANASVSGGVLNLLSGVSSNTQLNTIFNNFGVGNVLEIRAQRTALSTSNAGEEGFNGGALIRLFDNSATSGFWKEDPGTGAVSSANHPDTSYHVQSLARVSASETDFKTDAAASWEVKSGSFSTALDNLWLESFGSGGQNTSFLVDWVRTRPYSGADPATTVGSVQNAPAGNSLMFSIP